MLHTFSRHKTFKTGPSFICSFHNWHELTSTETSLISFRICNIKRSFTLTCKLRNLSRSWNLRHLINHIIVFLQHWFEISFLFRKWSLIITFHLFRSYISYIIICTELFTLVTVRRLNDYLSSISSCCLGHMISWSDSNSIWYHLHW